MNTRRARNLELTIYECGICDWYHPWDWHGDCREDINRYASPEEYAYSLEVAELAIEVRTMEEKVEADTREE